MRNKIQNLVLGIIVSVGTTVDVQAGSIARLDHRRVTGSTVATLTNAPIFPDFPTFREQLDDSRRQPPERCGSAFKERRIPETILVPTSVAISKRRRQVITISSLASDDSSEAPAQHRYL